MLEGDVSYIVFSIHEETTKNVDTEYTETFARLNSHNGSGTFWQNGISCVFSGLSVGSDMCQDISHLFSTFFILMSNVSE